MSKVNKRRRNSIDENQNNKKSSVLSTPNIQIILIIKRKWKWAKKKEEKMKQTNLQRVLFTSITLAF